MNPQDKLIKLIMKIKIEDKNTPASFEPMKGDVVQHKNGNVGIVYETVTLPMGNVKVIVMSELLSEDIDHSKLVCQWSKNGLKLFKGKITIES